MKVNKEFVARHVKSFVKTFATTFLAIWFYGIDQQGKDPFDPSFLLITAEFSFVAVMRTIYKILIEE